MSESLAFQTGQTLPSRTDTEAYVGNSVANVYLSFDRNDLTDEGLARLEHHGGSRFIVNSGTQDTLMTSFRMDYSGGEKKRQAFTVELVNPTLELEIKLMSIYDSVFPSTNPTFATLAAAENERRSMQGSDGEPITWETLNPKLPEIFIRFGYGSTITGGTSRILKTVLSNLSYTINANKDKVVVLMLTDLFTYWNASESFNNRSGIKKVSVFNPNTETLKSPSQILREVLGSYATLYPKMVPWISLGGKDKYSEVFDSMVFGLAAEMSDDLNYVIKDAIHENKESGQAPLSEGDMADIAQLLSRPVKEIISLNFNQAGPTGDGGITLEILIQAYAMAFKQLNLGWEFGATPLPSNQPNSPSEQQNNTYSDLLDNETDVWQQSNPDMARQLSEVKVLDSVEVNLVELGQNLESSPGPGYYSFWPKAIEQKPQADDIYTAVGTLTTPGVTPQKLRYEDSVTGDFTTIDTFKVNFAGDPLSIGVLSGVNEGNKIWFKAPLEESVGKRGMEVSFKDVGGMPGMDNFLAYIYIDGNPPLNSGTPVTQLENENGVSLGGLSTSGIILTIPSVSDSPPDGYGDLLRPLEVGYDDEAWFNENWNPSGGSTGEFAKASSVVEANPNPGPPLVRPMTVAEKHDSAVGGSCPIWIKPGVWNKGKKSPPKTYPPQFGGTVIDYDGEVAEPYQINNVGALEQGLASIFSIKELNELTPANTWQEAKEAYSDPASPPGVGNLPFLDVILPVSDKSGSARGKIHAKAGRVDMGYAPMYLPNSTELHLDSAAGGHSGKVPLLNLETGELVEGWSSIPGVGLEKNPLVQEAEDVLTWQESACDPDTMGRVTTSLRLEPTIETWQSLMLATTDLGKTGDEVTSSPEMPEEPCDHPPPRKPLELNPKLSAFVVLGTQGVKPNITAVLTNLVAAINNVVLGNKNKLVMSELDLSMLTPDEFDYVMGSLMAQLPSEDVKDFERTRPTLLCIAPEDELIARAFASLRTPIFSFPEITGRHPDIENTTPGELNKVLWLNYGGDNSIVTDIKFDAATRFLINMKDQYTAITAMARVADIGRQSKVSTQLISTAIKSHLTHEKDLTKEVTYPGTTEKNDTPASDTVVTHPAGSAKDTNTKDEAGLLEMITGMDGNLSSEFTPLPLAEYFASMKFEKGSEEALAQEQLQIAFSSPEIMEYFENEESEFVKKGGYYTSNSLEMQNERMVSKWAAKAEGVKYTAPKGSARFVNFAGIWGRLYQLTPKIMDSRLSFFKAMQQEVWQVEVQTLGIPELCAPAADLGAGRIIVLTVFDSRTAEYDRTPHWLSGQYSILGMNHEINANTGFLSNLKLMKAGPHPAFVDEGLFSEGGAE